jgi:hypothetical protein
LAAKAGAENNASIIAKTKKRFMGTSSVAPDIFPVGS